MIPVRETGLRSLGKEGAARFREYLQRLRGGDDAPPPVEDLSQEPCSLPVPAGITIDRNRRFKTRYEMGRYLVDRFKTCPDLQVRVDTEADPGVWAWLALVWFDQLCPRNLEGKRTPRADENYIPLEILVTAEMDNRRLSGTWGRHAVRTSYLLVREYSNMIDFVLSNPPNKRSDLADRLTERAYIAFCHPMVEAMGILYRGSGGKPKRGAKSGSAGSAKRFFKLVAQLALNYDLHSMTPEQIIDLLPKQEFARFMPLSRRLFGGG